MAQCRAVRSQFILKSSRCHHSQPAAQFFEPLKIKLSILLNISVTLKIIEHPDHRILNGILMTEGFMSQQVKRFFIVNHHVLLTDIALLIVRLFVGYALMNHGYGKIQNPMAWMGPDAPVPGVFQALAAISEFGGGLALILGLLTRLASLGIFFTMLVAAATHLFALHDPLINMTGGHSAEPAATYLVISLLILAMGPGRFSIDKKIFGSTAVKA